MKTGKWLAVMAAAFLLAGCNNFWQAPSGGGSTPVSDLSSGVFYVANQATNQVAAFSIVSGVLTKVSGSPYTLTSSPFAIAIAPNGNFLYVSTAQGIFLYTISSDGALTLANNGDVISSDLANTMQVDSTNSWLVEAGPNLAQVAAIPVNQSTGVPISTIEQKALLPAATIQQLTIAPDNAHVFVAMGAGGTEEVTFSSGGSNPFGTEQNFPVENSAGAAVSVAVAPDNSLVYIGETAAISGSKDTGGVRAFNYSTMTEISGSPYASGGLGPYSILPLSNGSVYVANRTVSGSSNGNITGFSVVTDGSTYTLSPLSTTASAGVQPVGIAVDSEGNYLLAVNFGGSPDLDAYTLDTTTAGKLDLALTGATGSSDPAQAAAIAALQ